MNKLLTSFNHLLLSAAVIIVALGTVLMPAYAGYKSYDSIPEDRKANIQVAWGWLKANGYSDAAAAGVLGNVNQESAFDPTLKQGSKPIDGINCSTVGTGSGSALGFFQWDGGRKKIMVCELTKNGGQWTDLKAQMKYALIDEMQASDPFKVYGRNYKKYCNAATTAKKPSDCSTGGVSGGIDEFKKIDDSGRAAIAWDAQWERSAATASSVNTRVDMAHEIYAKLKGTSGNQTGVVTSPGGGATYDVGKAGTGGIKDESELEGMPKDYTIEGAEDIESVSLDDLDPKHQVAMSKAKKSIALHGSTLVHVVTSFITLVGLIVIVWSVLLMAAAVFDQNNVFLDFSLTSAMSAGTVVYNPDARDTGVGVSGAGIVKRAVIGITVGIIIVSGCAFGIASSFVVWIGSL